jgi:hypothetical protein
MEPLASLPKHDRYLLLLRCFWHGLVASAGVGDGHDTNLEFGKLS